ncbi:MAG: DUF5694 domain-containing protein [Saprospiraceae bacterium]|nr:DUF5694 domain-containing protein [Saprospiraceae bacterium]
MKSKVFNLVFKGLLYLILFGTPFWTFLSCSTSQKGTFKDKKTEVLLVGVIHYIPDSLSCNWQSVYDKILRYKPDQISVEYIIPSDSASLTFSLGENYRSTWDSLTLAWQEKKNESQRIELWKSYHLNLDFANRDYQTYLLYKNMPPNLPFIDTIGEFKKFFNDRHKRLIAARKESEFFNLVFPLADALDIPYLYPTDERAYNLAQSEAYVQWDAELKNTAYMEKLNSFWKEFNETEAAQILTCNAIEFVNSRDWLEKSDYGQAQILHDTNNKYYKEYVNVWYKRNESIANRIIEASRASKARKMAVFYGYMHIAPVKKYLERQGFTVKLIGDLK